MKQISSRNSCVEIFCEICIHVIKRTVYLTSNTMIKNFLSLFCSNFPKQNGFVLIFAIEIYKKRVTITQQFKNSVHCARDEHRKLSSYRLAMEWLSRCRLTDSRVPYTVVRMRFAYVIATLWNEMNTQRHASESVWSATQSPHSCIAKHVYWWTKWVTSLWSRPIYRQTDK